MPLHEALYDSHTIRSTRPFTDWMPPLIVAVAGRLGFAPGYAYVADLMKADPIFPSEWYDLQRRDRLTRMVLTPIQIDDMVMSMQVPEGKRRMYEKTKRLVLRKGALDVPDAEVVRWIDKDSAPARPPREEHAMPLRELLDDMTKRIEALEQRAPATDAALPPDIAKRLDALETALAINGAATFDLGDLSLVKKMDDDSRARDRVISGEVQTLRSDIMADIEERLKKR